MKKKIHLYYSFWTNEAQLTVKRWNASKFRIPTSGPVIPFFLPPLFFTTDADETGEWITILWVLVKYRISKTYPAWPLWWSGRAKKPPDFPFAGPQHTQISLVMKGFCLAAFFVCFLEGTTMEQCIDYICTKKVCLKYKQRHGWRVEVSLYSVCTSSFR